MSFSMQYSHADMITNVVYTSGEERVYETGVSTNGTLAKIYGYAPLGRRAWTSDGSVTNWHVHGGMHVVTDWTL